MDFEYHLKDKRELTLEEYGSLERYRINLIKLTSNGNLCERFTEDKNSNLVKREVKFRSEIHKRILLEANNIARFLEKVKIK